MKASLNSTPHGPVAIPPRQGQLQLISPFGSTKPGGSDSSGKVMELGAARSSGVMNMTLSLPIIFIEKFSFSQNKHENHKHYLTSKEEILRFFFSKS